MTRPMDGHDVRPEFRAHLEWQIASALRREERFAAPVSSGSSRLRAVLVVVAAVVAGGAVVATSQELQGARQRNELLETARSEEALVRMRLDLAQVEYEEVRKRFEVGAAGREALQAAEQQRRAMENALARARLDIDEIQAAGAAPRNDLQAPLVGGRDYVRERLMLELETAQHALTAAEAAVRHTEERMRVGLAPRAAHLQADAERARAHARMQQLRASLELRQRALTGEIKSEEIASSLRRIELSLQRERLQRELQIGRERIAEMQRLVEVGQASALEVKRAEVDLLEREIELQRITKELGRLGSERR